MSKSTTIASVRYNFWGYFRLIDNYWQNYGFKGKFWDENVFHLFYSKIEKDKKYGKGKALFTSLEKKWY